MYSTSHTVEIVIYFIDLFNLSNNKILFWKWWWFIMNYYYYIERRENSFSFFFVLSWSHACIIQLSKCAIAGSSPGAFWEPAVRAWFDLIILHPATTPVQWHHHSGSSSDAGRVKVNSVHSFWSSWQFRGEFRACYLQFIFSIILRTT